MITEHSMPDIDLDLLRQWVGRERVSHDPMRPFPALALAAALDRTLAPGVGDVVPPGYQWLYFPEPVAASATAVDGHGLRGTFLPPVPLPRRMWAAGTSHFDRPLRFDRPATRRSFIRAVDGKSGTSGPLVFVTLDHEIVQDGHCCIREEQHLVYRDRPDRTVPMSAGPPAPHTADWSCSVTPDEVLLFRYSALTYNAHRIHYDRRYALEQELYPALVVHGPLLATLLLDLLRSKLDAASIASFEFRALRPAFDAQPLSLNGRRDAGCVQLWTADPLGTLCMSGTAMLG